MSVSKLVASTFTASLFALVVCMLVGPPLVLSIRVWVICFGAAAALLMLRHFYATVPVLPEQRQALFRLTSAAEQPVVGNRRIRALQGAVLSARDNERSFRGQLQPQLIGIARHFLRLNHGIDLDSEPDRAIGALGDLGWLIDTNSTGRPTPAELDRFIRVLTDAHVTQGLT